MKTSRAIPFVIAIMVMSACAGIAQAQDKTPVKTPMKSKVEAVKIDGAKLNEAKLEKMSGKDLYRTRCKVCHLPGSKHGEYTPMSLIMDQWEDFFSDGFVKTHQDVVTPQDETKKVPSMFNDKMLKKIKKFCVDHAADSEQPMTCG